MNILRHILAIIWTAAWGEYRYYRLRSQGLSNEMASTIAYLWGRREDPHPVKCENCGWRGPYRWLIHGYQWEHTDVDLIDSCPNCGTEV